MSSHNICFCLEIRKISVLLGREKTSLSGAMNIMAGFCGKRN